MALLTAASLGGLWLWADGARPFLRSKQPVLMEIPRGTRTWEIARHLEQSGVIRSRWTFLALRYLRAGSTLKAGQYSFERKASVPEVLRKLVQGEIYYRTLAIPEGYNRFEMADLMAAEGFATPEEFLRATEEASLVADLDPVATDLEGYLFPDTYHFAPGARALEMVRAMVDRFRQVYAGLPPGGTNDSLREIVTMASLVEKETGVPEERPVVAAVFYNRLRLGMPLQCDPTVIYAAILENRYDGVIRESQLRSLSPYNTYVHRGLPPGPIANPGQASLRAVLQPEPTDYLYFVANAEGRHMFSRTLAEHNLAVSQYRGKGAP